MLLQCRSPYKLHQGPCVLHFSTRKMRLCQCPRRCLQVSLRLAIHQVCSKLLCRHVLVRPWANPASLLPFWEQKKQLKYTPHQRYTLCLEAERGCKGIILRSCWRKTQNLRWLLTSFPSVQSHSGMPCLALIHALYEVTVVIRMATTVGKLPLLFVIFACNIGFRECFLPVSFAIILVQLIICIAEMRHKQQGADREL